MEFKAIRNVLNVRSNTDSDEQPAKVDEISSVKDSGFGNAD